MFEFFQLMTLMLVVLAMVPALAHALELPGKMRLTKDAYFAMQPIYYPGFTVEGGVGEVGGMVATTILLFLTPKGSSDFWLILTALLGLIAMHAVYWLFTHPVNKFWLQDQKLGSLGSGFFSFASKNRADLPDESSPADWTDLRDRWEYSHAARAALSGLSLILLLIATL